MSVGELAQTLGIRQPTLSQQLSVLRQEGLVSTRREGKQIYYAVSDEKALTILSTLYQLYCPAPGATP
jgi:ArsR family transcriptional regulator